VDGDGDAARIRITTAKGEVDAKLGEASVSAYVFLRLPILLLLLLLHHLVVHLLLVVVVGGALRVVVEVFLGHQLRGRGRLLSGLHRGAPLVPHGQVDLA